MKKLFIALAFLAMFAAAVPASAQDDLSFETVRVQLWPEYDQRSMLVIYTIQLPADVQLPAEVSVRIPASVGEPNAVAVDVNGALMTAQYQRTVSGEWADILVNAETHIVHLEYYDPSLAISGSTRSFTYTWPGVYAVDQFILQIQAPYKSSNMSFSANLGAPTEGDDGLDYYVASFGAVEAGQSFDFTMTYQRSSSRLTLDALNGGLPWWFFVMVGFGVVFVLAGAFYFLRGANQNSRSRSSKYANRRSRVSHPERRPSGGRKFCHKCGSTIQSGDKFCRECGEKLRV